MTLTPNPEQQAVIDAGDGVFAIYSGPGSGKSFCLIHRYARLVNGGISPDDILCVTFTAASAKSMRDRADDLIPVQKMDRVSGWMTLHSLALKFVEQERANFPMELAEFPLCLEPQSNRLAWEAGKRYEVDPRRLKNFIGLQKRQSIRPIQAIRAAEKEHKDEKLALAYKYYETKMREAKVLDFDSLLMEMRHVLESNDEVRERWQYRFIQLDESQDTDEQQFQLLRLLTQQYGNLLAVGDTQQGLYGFRGARGDLFQNMESIFPGTAVLYLAKNHRSTVEIVNFLKEIGPDRDLAARFHTDNLSGPEPVITKYAGPAEEAKAIAGTAGHGCAILARTNRALRPIEDALSITGVKYRLLGKCGFYQQPEIKAALGYLQCAVFPSDSAVGTALRAPFWPSKFVKKSEVAAKIKAKPEGELAINFLHKTHDDAVQKFVHFLDTLKRYRDLPAKDATSKILDELRAFEHYQDHGDPDNDPTDNLKELAKISTRFSSLKDFLDYTRRASNSSKSKKPITTLATVHSAKGMEWDVVYLIQCSEGVLPHAKAESIEEEKNIFFVAASRPKRELRISFTGQPSRFLLPFLKEEKSERLRENGDSEIRPEETGLNILSYQRD